MRRLDESMSLLSDLQRDPLEPGYRQAAAAGGRNSKLRLAITLTVLAAMIALAGAHTFKSSADFEDERTALIQQIGVQQDTRNTLDEEVRELEVEIRDLQEELVTDPELREDLTELGILTGDLPVIGPGIVIDIDDSPKRDEPEGLVYDSDLVRLVNGLRQAGAEAIAINGRRLSTQTPIRAAGAAITVDYVSLSPPYHVEAVGDPDTLQAKFARTSAAVWWKYLSDNFGVGFSVRESNGDLELDAVPGVVLRNTETE